MRNKSLVMFGVIIGLASASATAIAKDVDYSSNLTGNWGGARQQLHDRGIDLGADYVGEFAYNTSGGLRHTQAYADQFHISGVFDFDRLFGWRGGSLHVDVINRNGELLNDKAGLGTYGVTQVNEIYGTGNITRLFNFYLEQSLWDDKALVKLGRMGVGVDFFPFSCDFQNLVFCGDLPSYITQGMMDWPLSQIGATVTINPSKEWYFKVGGYEVNPNNALTSNGLRLFPRGDRVGTLTMVEAGINTTLGSGDTQLPGHWRIGGWYNTADFPDLLLDVNGMPQVLTGAPAMMVHSITGYYAMAQQQVTSKLTLFGNFIQADSKTDPVSQIAQVGMLYNALFASRPNDTLGLAVGRQRGSDRVATSERIMNANGLGPVPVQGSEYLLVINYKARVYHGISLMPNLQYIHHPGGASANSNVTVLGLQLGITF